LNKKAELAANWPILVGSFVGIMLSATIFPFYILGPLIRPLQAEFGWSRTGLSACLSLLAGGTTVGTFIVGQLIERASVRMVAITSMAAYALSFGLFALFGGQLWHFQLLYLVVGLLGAGCGPLAYTKAIGASFVSARGIALGIALSGAGIAGFVGPLLIQSLQQAAGWRVACATVGALVLLVGIPVVFYAFGGVSGRAAVGRIGVSPEAQRGASALKVSNDPRFYLLLSIIVTFGLLIGSLIIHLVPMLVAGGVSPARAAVGSSLLGISGFFGRLIVGWLLDRFSSTLIGATLFITGALGAAMLAAGELHYAFWSIAAFGLLTGAELDLLSFITLRYFGVHAYGKTYGWLFSAYTGVSILGPFLGAAVIDSAGFSGFYAMVAFCFFGIAALYILLDRVARKSYQMISGAT
jgi:MFS family permease